MSAAVSDRQGNLYIAGSTTSIDFPTSNPAQSRPGGSILTRINLANAVATRLFPANFPSITYATADPENPGTLYASSRNEIWKSSDAGVTWTRIYGFPDGVIVNALAVSPRDTGTRYAGTSTMGAFKSNDGGLTWSAINSGISTDPQRPLTVSAIWVAPTKPDVLFASTGSGLVRSADGGGTWNTVAGVSSPAAIAFDPAAPGTVYAAGWSFIAKSTDEGRTFAPLTGVPDQTGITALVSDPRLPGTLYAGTFNGIYYSADGGATWNLKRQGVTNALVRDPDSGALYANLSSYGIVKSTDGFTTTTPVGAEQPYVRQLLLSGPDLFEVANSTADVFVVKLDNDGNIVYSTYFGGSGDDSAAGIAVGPDGSVFIAGSTTSIDFPVTASAYLTQSPTSSGVPSSYLFKLNADGTLAWASYFAGSQSTVASIAVDSGGNPVIGGYTSGGHPVTQGAYQTSFQQTQFCTGFIGCFGGPTSAFVTKCNRGGTGLIYSTYIATDSNKNLVQGARAMAVDSGGNVWIGVAVNPNLVPSGGGTNASVVELNSTGSALIASIAQPALGTIGSLALDSESNVYVAGSYSSAYVTFPATPGAFQQSPQPVFPVLAYEPSSGGGSDAFVARFDKSLTRLTAATILGGELPDAATSLAVDRSGTVIVSGYTDSKAFPTHVPSQESFSGRTGFVAGFDPNLSTLLFSTYVGDERPFSAQAVALDGNGNLLLAGSTLTTGSLFIGGDRGASFLTGDRIVANKIALGDAPAVRLDSVQNYASHLPNALAPGEPVIAVGAAFDSGAQIVLDGSPIPAVSATPDSVVAVLPDSAKTVGYYTVQVSSNGTLSNPVLVPAAPASPAIYTADGSGTGQASVLNSDGTKNSPSNPAAPGSAITILAAGPGAYSESGGYAVTAATPSVFIGGFYANGVAAKIGPVEGFPGNVYQLSVYVPDPAKLAANNPNLENFKLPPQVPIQLVMGLVHPLNYANSEQISQHGVFISIAQ